jgi:hypothetical protein
MEGAAKGRPEAYDPRLQAFGVQSRWAFPSHLLGFVTALGFSGAVDSVALVGTVFANVLANVFVLAAREVFAMHSFFKADGPARTAREAGSVGRQTGRFSGKPLEGEWARIQVAFPGVR